MRILIVIGLLVAATFAFLFVVADIARDLSRQSFQAPPDLDGSDDWDVADDEFADNAPPVVCSTERRAVSRHPIGSARDDVRGNSNALDDFHSAL